MNKRTNQIRGSQEKKSSNISEERGRKSGEGSAEKVVMVPL